MTYKKLQWIQEGEIQITSGFQAPQTTNGKPQAQDFQSKPLFAPERCRVMKKTINRSNPYASWANIQILDTVGTVYFQIVHFEVEKPEGYVYQKGEAITGKDTSGNNHFHITLNINNVWRKILEFTKQDRNIKIVYNRWIGAGGWSTFDFEKWSFYDSKGDKAIQFRDPTPTPPPAPKPQRTYTVKSGDFLNKIAKEQLGNSSRYLEIYNLNKDI
ncbi:MAG: LysM peptidoglycan-binding domain-containing protein, partial [Fusobacteriaceae bacterium]